VAAWKVSPREEAAHATLRRSRVVTTRGLHRIVVGFEDYGIRADDNLDPDWDRTRCKRGRISTLPIRRAVVAPVMCQLLL
jgi:hypothetical protein